MPRRSAADLSIVPMLPGKGRPEPPKALDQIEARAWNDVIDALPASGSIPPGSSSCAAGSRRSRSPSGSRLVCADLAMMGDDPEALEAETDARRHASGDREGGRRRFDGIEGDAAQPHGGARRANAVRARRGRLQAVGDRRQEVRWAGLVSNPRRPGRSPRPT